MDVIMVWTHPRPYAPMWHAPEPKPALPHRTVETEASHARASFSDPCEAKPSPSKQGETVYAGEGILGPHPWTMQQCSPCPRRLTAE